MTWHLIPSHETLEDLGGQLTRKAHTQLRLRSLCPNFRSNPKQGNGSPLLSSTSSGTYKILMPSRPSRPSRQGPSDAILYAFTILALVYSLYLGYNHMPGIPGLTPSPPITGLNRAMFNPRLYSHLQSFWFDGVPADATAPPEAAVRRWYTQPKTKARAAIDGACRRDFLGALESVGPKRLQLHPFTNWVAERNHAKNLASPFMTEIDHDDNPDLTSETASRNALSIILLLDQISRNIYRHDQKLIYDHYDRLAQALIHHVLASTPRLDLDPKYKMYPVYRLWFYMPLMHSEHIEDHRLCKELYGQMKDEMAARGDQAAVDYIDNALRFEEKHVAIIEKFGRYPYRNGVMGRETIEAEKKWMEEGGENFGTG